jgi:hypothetical protein
MFADSNVRLPVAVTLAAGLVLAGCGPATSSGPPPSPAASARATRSPVPTLAEGMTRFSGTITDTATGRPIAGVCVVIGPRPDCLDNMPHSEEDGTWFADLPVAGGLSWTFTFLKDGYATTVVKATSDAPGKKTLDVRLSAN